LHRWTEITVEEWDRVQAVNVRGSFLCARAVFPAMKEQGKGKIVNIASSVVFNPLRNVHYVASKAAVIGLTRALARELGPWNIAVNAVSPGLIQTDNVLGVQSEEMVNQIVSAQCFKRLGQSDDLIGAILFLSSDLSDFITGQVLAVDGGWTMH
jgi:3-oxoacyl-[acyl-carrier protein] reductase